MLDGQNNFKIDLGIREKWIVKFYNRLSKKEAKELLDIPPDDLSFIRCIPYESIVTPFIKEYSKLGRRIVSERFNIGDSVAKRLVK